eukprot:GHRQ01024368.1.p3 GENE.GHRQ01024368.1~~GHRQ01024368.1.p3  ORF type:complete len:102 (+),score=23.68 GHRQ01024368.1:59-364(+)
MGACSNPLSRNHLASPVAVTGMKTMGLKMAMVLISTVGGGLGNTQDVLMLICAAIIVYYMITTVRCMLRVHWCVRLGHGLPGVQLPTLLRSSLLQWRVRCV